MLYYMRHVRENAYADHKGRLVKDWHEAITFSDETEANIFFMGMESCWDMCECSEEQWKATGGRLTPPHEGITLTINGKVVYRQEKI